jgi:phage terminase large subunit
MSATATAQVNAPAAPAVELVHVTDEVQERWTLHPIAFAREALKFAPDEWQTDVLQILEIYPRVGLRIAMMACKGPGKSALLAVIILWFLFTRPQCKIICTSITSKNLEDGLWAELSLWGAPLKNVFDFTKTRIEHRQHRETWFCSKRSWPRDADKSQQANTLAGVHARFVMIVLDEVSDMPEGVVGAAEGNMSTGQETILCVAGNCTRTIGSPLYRMATRDRWSRDNPHGVHLVRITGDPDDPRRSKRVSIDWALKLIRDWGRDHNIVRTNVLAEFPSQGSNKLLGLEDVERAMTRDCREPAFQDSPKVIGVDVARFGDDSTIFFPRQGILARPPRKYPYANRGFLGQARDLIELADRFQMDAGFIEINGLGCGLWDAVEQLDKSDRWIPVNVSTTEGVNPRFENLRAQMAWECAEWIKASAVLPDVPELIGDATAISYDVSKRTGKLIITDKGEIKELLGRSPDYWDSLQTGFAAPVVARRAKTREFQPIPYAPGGRRASDYNPFSRSVA